MHDFLVPSTVAFIQEAHAGQKYGNMPYFFHPIEVAEMAQAIVMHSNHRLADLLQLDNIVTAALLHDVIEDTKYTAVDLRERFTLESIDMVVLLTKDDSLDYRANIQRIIDSGNRGAMIVKLADNRVNRGGDKSAMDSARAEKLNARYDMSIAMLEAALYN